MDNQTFVRPGLVSPGKAYRSFLVVLDLPSQSFIHVWF